MEWVTHLSRQLDTGLFKFTGRIHLRTSLIVPFIVIVVTAVALTGYLAFRSGRAAVTDLAGQLHQEITARVQQHLETYLATPYLINQLNLNDIELGLLDIEDIGSLERPFFSELLHFENVASIYYADEDASFLAPGRNTMERALVSGVSGASTGYALEMYELDARGTRLERFARYPDYDPRSRPWYQATVQRNGPTWTPIYVWTNGEIGLDATVPVHKDGALRGVLGVSLTLDGISDFLHGLTGDKQGQTFIVERSGLLVAASTISEPYALSEDQLERLSALDCDDPLIRAAIQHLEQRFGTLSNIQAGQAFDFSLSGERYLARATPYIDDDGLDWLIVVAVPEAVLMGEASAIIRTTTILVVISLLVALLVAVLLAGWVTRPIRRLSQSAGALAQGDWAQRITLDRQDEIGDLEVSFNQMAEQLQESFDSLQASEAEYRQLTIHLEDLVAARTAELRQEVIEHQRVEASLRDLNETLEQRVAERSEALEAELAERQRLEQEAARLQMLYELDRLRSEFVSNMSHELRTPLGLIQAAASSLLLLGQTDAPPETQKTLLLGIEEETERLEQLVDNLLALPLVKDDSLRLVPTWIDLSGLIDRLVQIRQAVAPIPLPDLPVYRFVYVPPQLPPVLADARRIEQVVRNLLSNAVKYSPGGGTITVQACCQDGFILVQVSDQGIGIAPRRRERLFERYYRVEDEAAHGIGGVGLGLYISRKIVQAHGGSIWVESEQGKGSTFFFTLPLPNDNV